MYGLYHKAQLLEHSMQAFSYQQSAFSFSLLTANGCLPAVGRLLRRSHRCRRLPRLFFCDRIVKGLRRAVVGRAEGLDTER